jgi:hypothetical protein
MKNFKKYHSKINSIVDKTMTLPKVDIATKGIVQRPAKKEEAPSGKMTSEQQVARYVEIIRKQKKELLNDKA